MALVDVSAETRTFLAAQATLTALTGTSTRLLAERSEPLPGYKPSDGACLCFKVRGGVTQTEESVLLAPSMQFKCYGGQSGDRATEREAQLLYRTLVDVLHGARAGTLRWAQLEILGRTLNEPETGWPFVLAFFEITIAN